MNVAVTMKVGQAFQPVKRIDEFLLCGPCNDGRHIECEGAGRCACDLCVPYDLRGAVKIDWLALAHFGLIEEEVWQLGAYFPPRGI